MRTIEENSRALEVKKQLAIVEEKGEYFGRVES